MSVADDLFKTVLTRDPRMMVPDSINDYPIKKGAIENNFTTIEANSKDPSKIQFEWNPPSLSNWVDRNIIMETVFQGKLTITTPAGSVANGTNVCAIGSNLCLNNFPLHRITVQSTLSINDAVVNGNPKEFLTPFVQMMDEERMNQYSTFTPVMADRLAEYSDALGTPLSPFNDYKTFTGPRHSIPRGAYNFSITSVSRNSGVDNSLVKVADGDSWEINYEVRTRESCLLPPCSNSKDSMMAYGFLGVNKLHIRYTLERTSSKLFSSALSGTATFDNYITAVPEARLIVNYLGGSYSSEFPSRSIYNYFTTEPHKSNGPAILSHSTSKAFFPNLNIGEIPSLIILYARKTYDLQTAMDADVVFPMSNLNVNFNGRSSRMNPATTDQLYYTSKRNGLNNVDYLQFLGVASSFASGYTSGANGTQNNLYLSGGCVVLDPSLDLGLSNDLITNSSQGQFQFSWSADIFNPTNKNFAGNGDVELLSVLVYNEFMILSNGFGTIRKPGITQLIVQEAISSGRVLADFPAEVVNQKMMGGCLSCSVAGVNGGVARSAGVARSGGKRMAKKLDALLM